MLGDGVRFGTHQEMNVWWSTRPEMKAVGWNSSSPKSKERGPQIGDQKAAKVSVADQERLEVARMGGQGAKGERRGTGEREV